MPDSTDGDGTDGGPSGGGRCGSTVSHRAAGGPDLTYLRATEPPHPQDLSESDGRKIATSRRYGHPILHGQTLYLGGEEGPDGRIYCVPGHASRVLCVDTATDDVYPVGPVFDGDNCVLGGRFKWLRGITVGDVIYGLPCHADTVLRIDTRTDGVGTLRIPYEEYFDEPEGEGGTGTAASRERNTPWKYHGGCVSPHDGAIYAIPQTARRVLRIDPETERVSFVGPELAGRCKWYGGVVGRSDGAIYGIPQNAESVLRIDPSGVAHDGPVVHETSGLPSQEPERRVLVTTHGSFPNSAHGEHKWHGAAASGDGTIVSVPNNADTVLCVGPAPRPAYPPADGVPFAVPEPELYELEGRSPGDVATGRHRDDRKYKYLGATAGPDGRVYCFPSGSERVLQVDTSGRVARSVGPNLRDAGMEGLFQNKWQNGLCCRDEGCVYAIPLGASTLLRIRTGREGETLDEPEVTTWALPEPRKTLEKFEGGVMASNGCMYCMPNNLKAVLRIVPPCVPSRLHLDEAREAREAERERVRIAEEQRRRDEQERRKAEKERKRRERLARKKEASSAATAHGGGEEKKEDEVSTAAPRKVSSAARPAERSDGETTPDGVAFKYRTGIPTLRSSAHRVKYSLEHRRHDPKPKNGRGDSTNTTFLPAELCRKHTVGYSESEYDFHSAVADMLRRCDQAIVGDFRTLSDGAGVDSETLDNFVVPVASLTRRCQGGVLEEAQEYLSEVVSSDGQFLGLFDRFVREAVLPDLKRRLQRATGDGSEATFHYQRPPTIRIQPGPARAYVRAHSDDEYGHQNGELNYWLPLTGRAKTGVDLHCESRKGEGDHSPLGAERGTVVSFHGSSCRHYVNSNHSPWTRISLDFRVGVEGYFDPEWQMLGTSNDHPRCKVTI